MTKEAAYNKIEELVIRFTEQIDSYKKSDYNETQTRRDFIDPFFKALGWDVDNENGNADGLNMERTLLQEETQFCLKGKGLQ